MDYKFNGSLQVTTDLSDEEANTAVKNALAEVLGVNPNKITAGSISLYSKNIHNNIGFSLYKLTVMVMSHLMLLVIISMTYQL